MSESHQMLPEVHAYVNTLRTATEAYEEASAEVERQYPKRYDYDVVGLEQAAAARAARGKAVEDQEQAYEAAWAELAKASDPLVRWVAEHCEEYRGEARSVLEILPASLEELDRLADAMDWCGVWISFREQAIEAGVVPGARPTSAARTAVLDGIDAVSCCRLDAGARLRVHQLLDAFLEAETKTQPAAA